MMSTSVASEIAERGMTLFEDRIKKHVAGVDPEAFIAIDVDSGDYEISRDDIQVFDALRTRRPEAVIFLRRVGSDIVYLMGGDLRSI